MKIIKSYTIDKSLADYIEKRAKEENRSASNVLSILIQKEKSKGGK